MDWLESAKYYIRQAHDRLPAGISFDDRKRAIAAAYPWGERKHHPCKMWLKAQREYLLRYAPPSLDTKRFPLSPLERAAERARRLSHQNPYKTGDA